jgi:hypothetical protein
LPEGKWGNHDDFHGKIIYKSVIFQLAMFDDTDGAGGNDPSCTPWIARELASI